MMKGLTVGVGLRGQSGVPLSFLGDHPIYLNQGEVPIGGRGAAGRTPSASQLDMHLDYPMHFGERVQPEAGDGHVQRDQQPVRDGRVQFTQLGSACALARLRR